MKSIKIDLGDNLDKVVILPIADVHFGDKDCNIDKVKEVMVKMITFAIGFYLIQFIVNIIFNGINDIGMVALSDLNKVISDLLS